MHQPCRCLPRRFFRRLTSLFAFFILFLVPYAQVSAAERVLTVGVYDNPPKVGLSKEGKPTGIFIDIIEAVAVKEGWALRYKSGTWEEGLDRLRKGEIDLMPDVAYTGERAERFVFHREPVLASWSQVYAPKGSGIKSVLDLDGKRVAVLAGSVQEEAFKHLARSFGFAPRLVPFSEMISVFQKTAEGQADAAVTNRFFGMMHARSYGLEDTAVIFQPTQLFFAASKTVSPDVLAALDRRLALLKKEPDSVYYRSLKHWLSEETPFQIPPWLPVVALIAGWVLLMSLIGSFWLKHQVNVRTRELKRMNQEMEQRILDRTAELAAAMEKAQSADRLKSAFLATMSHELRTPLNSIIGFTGVLLQELPGPLNDEQRLQLGMVQNSARHLLALINDVLDISKIEAGQLTLASAPFSLRDSLEKTIRMVAPAAEKKGLALEVHLAPDLGTVLGDQRRFEQIVLNLLNNAVKFTETGKVTLSARRENGGYRVLVSDTGIGIEAEEISRIFKPFHQIDTGLTRKYEGTGLGLAICKKLVEMMGGSITVDSRPGQGSTFTVLIPEKGEGDHGQDPADH